MAAMKVSPEYFSTKLLHISKVYYQDSFLFEGQMNNLFISVIKHVLLHVNIYALEKSTNTTNLVSSEACSESSRNMNYQRKFR